MQPKVFAFIAAEMYKRSGIALEEDKLYLLESRLAPIARRRSFDSVEAMLLRVMAIPDEPLMHELVQSMTTNETSFFRDRKPFELLTSIMIEDLKPIIKEDRPLRIWSAACSSGQEPYTIAIALTEAGVQHMDIVATDLCEKVLLQAEYGKYSQFEVQRGLPIQLLLKYFEQKPGNEWRINEMIRSKVRFTYHNLVSHIKAFEDLCDIVFCRNVLIYFDDDTKYEALEQLSKHMKPGAYLMTGNAEIITGLHDAFKPVGSHSGLYQYQP